MTRRELATEIGFYLSLAVVVAIGVWGYVR